MNSSSTNDIVFVSPRRRTIGRIWITLAVITLVASLTIGRENDPWIVQIGEPSQFNPFAITQIPGVALLLLMAAFVSFIRGAFVISTSGHRGRHRS